MTLGQPSELPLLLPSFIQVGSVVCGARVFFLRALYLGAEIRACSGAIFRVQGPLCRGRELLVDGSSTPCSLAVPKAAEAMHVQHSGTPCRCPGSGVPILFPKAQESTVKGGGRQQLPPRHLVREHLGHLELQRFLIRFH